MRKGREVGRRRRKVRSQGEERDEEKWKVTSELGGIREAEEVGEKWGRESGEELGEGEGKKDERKKSQADC